MSVPRVDLRLGDNRDVLATLPDESVSAIICDPPYEIAFMGRKWDASGIAYDVDLWRECLRVAKPGAHLAAFGGTRTYHRLAVAIEDAGWEIRDSLVWLYSQGWPKGYDVGLAVDATLVHGGSNSRRIKAARTSRENTGGPLTPEAQQWDGWDTTLAPAQEPIVLARKPIAAPSVAANVLRHGTGALNVDACRTPTSEPISAHHGTGNPRTAMSDGWLDSYQPGDAGKIVQTAGRWPVNVVLVHAESCRPPGVCDESCPVAEMDRQSGNRPGGNFPAARTPNAIYDGGKGLPSETGTAARNMGDSGGASRFFPTFKYQAKAPASERPKIDGKGWPTVKPLALMRWLVRLLTPPGGLVVDPFAGTGTTLQAARDEGFPSLGVEADEFAYRLARQRLNLDAPQAVDDPLSLFDLLDGQAS